MFDNLATSGAVMKTRVVLVVATALGAAASAEAQVPAQPGQTRFGVGIALAPATLDLGQGATQQSSYIPVGFGDLYFPLLVGRAFKLEAQAGLLKYKSEVSYPYSATYTANGTSLRLGLGAFAVKPLGGSATLVYFGPRVQWIRTTYSADYGAGSPAQTVTEVDWVFAGVLGGEHFLSEHFSLGAELQLDYVRYGTPSYDQSTGSVATVSQSMVATTGLLMLRAYF
jgi:Outer membrane protein beta-barrel domain